MNRLPLAALLLIANVGAAGTAPPKQPPIDCRDATHRAPGFWVGHWSVSPTGTKTPVATSRIEWIVGGCAIRESFEQTVGPGGKPMNYHGTSYTAYNANDNAWHQFYVDDQGHASSFRGDITGKSMVLMTDGPAVINRMTVSAQDDGSVRQRGEVSLDRGKTWKPGYDFTYRRIAE
ncbi:MAG TPA: hypothetical protein VGK80_12390 [Rhodanobacteraceae bacterium]